MSGTKQVLEELGLNNLKVVFKNSDACNIKLQGEVFKSGEHAYQWMKASSPGHSDLAGKIQLAETPRESKQIVESLSQTDLDNEETNYYTLQLQQ